MCLLCAHKELIECACAAERVILSCTGSKRSQKEWGAFAEGHHLKSDIYNPPGGLNER